MILVTGSSGFIGQHLVKTFRNENIITISRSGSMNDLTLTSETDLSPLLSGVDCCIHLANTAHGKSIAYSEIYANNVDMTLNLFKQCQVNGVKKFIYISTANNLDDLKTGTLNYYQTKTKKIVEKEMLMLVNQFSMQVLIIRCPMIYGKGVPGNLDKLKKLFKYFPFSPFKSIDNKISILSVNNLVDLIREAVYNIDFESQIILAEERESIKISRLIDILVEDRKVIHLNVNVDFLAVAFSLLGLKNMYVTLCCNSKLDHTGVSKSFSWCPKYTIGNTISKV
ncbi:NAD-dependent epimerase/dehydratase family protein [Vibrio parahaemolyticus]|uniref:NAD-dependent epimerase/dehydratase domain-containing protein n=1 Tax=Vibrio parahaemolyticus TaxID=670 RepID=A0A7M1WCF8_VIBPH|nr:NAD-dependent epimerase/dehydratase family protein [Vibrio parahaemolyticus]EHR6711116.1 NAD-dependent epimerase/dehydratase family protein [Vibrio parahaemolyticus]MCG9636487.1 NAD-dependent epimerase/dehydratase family protein [Vibrio parahaemolyticus]QOS24468.1 hypothetical protein VP32_00018 [Vibrio parahaemolyticus]HCE2247242.1 NAD-dependent epimerase/dehydratase family protein [Vibrio parahaemolyticus]